MRPFDYSTISVEKTRLLPKWKDTGKYHLQSDPGNGCMLDPPGFPTYFTRSIYTRRGDNPRNGPQMVISIPEGEFVVQDNADWNGRDWDSVSALWSARLSGLYVPLPIDHPRVQAWVQQLFGYFRDSYVDMNKPEKIRRNCAELIHKGSLDHHRATMDIREWYPEFQPTQEHVASGTWGIGSPGDWWERYAERPPYNECPGMHGRTHPSNISWCQMCGYIVPKKVD